MRPLRAILAAAGVMMMAACATLPTSGGVQTGVEAAPESEGVALLPVDPRPGDGPEQIVRGFIEAATAGASDRYVTARKYLTDNAAERWRPEAGVTIYAGPTLNIGGADEAGHVATDADMVGYVDEAGVYTEEADGTTAELAFDLVQVGDQWRISSLDDGVLISSVNFGTQYRQTALYFLSPDLSFLVPDTRWFPERNAATFAVEALLAGPAQWLNRGVVTAVPSGTEVEPVTVAEGVASVDLSGAVMSASAADRNLLVAQLRQTLEQLPQVRQVEVSVDGAELTATPASDLTADPAVGRSPRVLAGGLESEVNGAEIAPVPGSVELGENAYTGIAVGYQDEPTVALADGGRALVTLPVDGSASRELARASSGLARPSYDRFGWAWTGAAANTGSLLAAPAAVESADAVEVSAAAFAGGDVRGLRVSRDGTRLAAVVDIEGSVQVEVAAIIRDAEGTPLEIGEPETMAASITLATDVIWVDEQSLGVLGISQGDEPAVHLVKLGGPSAALPTVSGADTVAAGRGAREMWVGTDDGDLYFRSGNGWRLLEVEDDVAILSPAFPG